MKNMRERLNKIKKRIWILMIPFFIAILGNKCWAIGNLIQSGSIGTAEVTRATDNVKNAIIKLAMPIGGVLVFASVVIISIKMIVNANNANISGLAWVVAGTLLLGLSLIVSGIIISIATNGTGNLVN